MTTENHNIIQENIMERWNYMLSGTFDVSFEKGVPWTFIVSGKFHGKRLRLHHTNQITKVVHGFISDI
jgi:hypothetical protein